MKEAEIKAILRLLLTKGIGPNAIKSLVAGVADPREIFTLSVKDLCRVQGIGPAAAKNILGFNDWDKVEAEWAFLQKHRIEALPFYHHDYPKRLKELGNAPPMLFYRGSLPLNQSRMIGIVGSRKATNYGKEFTQKIVEELSPYKPIIVSGLAYGIDIEAHKASVKNDLATIGVLAHGLDTLYPALHRATAKQMVRNGGLLTEFMSETHIVPELFPRRNRIVAGLIDGLIIVETTRKGGALITADIAFSYNREVMAYPGRTVDPLSSGCNQLIKMHKASLVESAEDIAWIMGWPEPKQEKHQDRILEQLNGVKRRIYQTMKTLPPEGTSFEKLQGELGMETSELSLQLLNMELDGHLISLPGNHYKVKHV